MDKPRWVQITDPAEREALMLGGKYREDRPTLVRKADALWALVDAQFKKWRAEYSGKISCQND